ncbi:MAG: MORN repeat-containing protein [Bacteroidia bacterium]
MKLMAEVEAALAYQMEQLGLLDTLLKADEWIMFEGDFDKSRAAFEEMLSIASPELTKRLEMRIAYFEELFHVGVQENELLGRKDQLIYNQGQRLQKLEAEADSLEALLASGTKAMEVRYQALEKEKQKLEAEMAKKERVKVISFPGSKGATVHYMGEVVDGKANGGGIGIWTTGSIYRGEWRNNLRHGKGSFSWKDGERYEGTYVDGRREGEGTYYWPSGERYEGMWMSDQRNGQETLFDLDGNVRYKGEWKDDKPVTK